MPDAQMALEMVRPSRLAFPIRALSVEITAAAAAEHDVLPEWILASITGFDTGETGIPTLEAGRGA